MYCKMYWIANGAILKKNNVWKILVELYSAILVRFSIFSIQVALIVRVYTGISIVYIYTIIRPVWAVQVSTSRRYGTAGKV